MKLISDVTKAWKVVEDSQKSPDQAEWIDPVIAGAVEQLEADKQSIRDKRDFFQMLVGKYNLDCDKMVVGILEQFLTGDEK